MSNSAENKAQQVDIPLNLDLSLALKPLKPRSGILFANETDFVSCLLTTPTSWKNT